MEKVSSIFKAETQVQVQSQVTGVSVELKDFFDFFKKLCLKSSNLWIESNSSPSHVTWAHRRSDSAAVCARLTFSLINPEPWSAEETFCRLILSLWTELKLKTVRLRCSQFVMKVQVYAESLQMNNHVFVIHVHTERNHLHVMNNIWRLLTKFLTGFHYSHFTVTPLISSTSCDSCITERDSSNKGQ